MLVQLLQEQVSGPVTFIGEGENQTSVHSLLYNALYRGRNARPLPRPFILVVAANPSDVEKAIEFAHEHKLRVISTVCARSITPMTWPWHSSLHGSHLQLWSNLFSVAHFRS